MSLTEEDLIKIGEVVDQRLEIKLEEKLEVKLEEKLDSKLDEKLDKRFSSFETKMDEKLDSRFNDFEIKFDEKLDKRFNDFDARMDRKFESNNRRLIQMMFEHFATKKDVEEIFDRKIEPVKDQIRGLQEVVISVDAKFTESIAMTDNKIFRLDEKISTNSRRLDRIEEILL